MKRNLWLFGVAFAGAGVLANGACNSGPPIPGQTCNEGDQYPCANAEVMVCERCLIGDDPYCDDHDYGTPLWSKCRAWSHGATSASVGSSTTSSSSSSAGGGGGGCSGVVKLIIDKSAEADYRSNCSDDIWAKGSSTAFGYQLSVGPPSGDPSLILEGCATSLAHSEGLKLTLTEAAKAGTFTSGTVQWTDPNGTVWTDPTGNALSVTVSNLDIIGYGIDGSFTTTVSNGTNAVHALTGTFHVCHVNDAGVP